MLLFNFVFCFRIKAMSISSMLLPLQLSPQGVVAAHASGILRGSCQGASPPCCSLTMFGPDRDKAVPYYNPAFWCTARAICFGPGDSALCIFPRDDSQLVVPFNKLMTTSKPSMQWSLRVECAADVSPFVFHRHTTLESILTHPQLTSRFVMVPLAVMQQLRQQHLHFLTPPVDNILCPQKKRSYPEEEEEEEEEEDEEEDEDEEEEEEEDEDEGEEDGSEER